MSHKEGYCYWCSTFAPITHIARLHGIAGGVAYEGSCTRCAEKQSGAAWIAHFKIPLEPDFTESLRSMEGLER